MVKKYVCGNDMNRMPDFAFRMMARLYRIMDLFYPFEKRIKLLGIREGETIVDYGCGPGRYTRRFSTSVGEKGKVYAADIHELAIEAVRSKMKKYDLKNVEPVLIEESRCPIADQCADRILALDMFHMVKDHRMFLTELHRILKPDGVLILENGHQPRQAAKAKVIESGLWDIIEETKEHLKCRVK